MYVSVRDGHLPGTFGTIKAGLDAMGIDAVELHYTRQRSVTSLDLPGGTETLANRSAIDAFGYKCEGLKIKPTSFLLSNNFGGADLDAEIEWVVSAMKAADHLGMKAVRIDAIMSTEREWPLEKRISHFADCMHRVLDATKSSNVSMGIENHGGQGNTPEFLDAVLNKVDSPRLGLTLDTANLYWYGHPLSKVRQIITHFAPRVKHTHAKNINYPADKREIQREIGWEYGQYCCALRKGDIDMKWLVKTLADAGYTGDMCIENESLGRYTMDEQKAILRDDADYLKEVLAGK